MKGYQMDSVVLDSFAGSTLHDSMHNCGIKSLMVDVYGVRKTDIEFIKTQKNWINVEEFIAKELNAVTPAQLKTLAMSMADRNRMIRYNEAIAKLITSKKSPYYVASMNIKDSEKLDIDQRSLNRLCEAFKVTIDVDTLKEEIIKEHTAVYARYPLLAHLSGYAEAEAVAHYINLVDKTTK
jgi:hypothetical protein